MSEQHGSPRASLSKRLCRRENGDDDKNDGEHAAQRRRTALEDQPLEVAYADGEREQWPLTVGAVLELTGRGYGAADDADDGDSDIACHPLQRPSFLFSGLRARPTWTSAPEFAALVAALERAWPALRAEALSAVGESKATLAQWEENAEGLHDGSWKKLTLWSCGRPGPGRRAAPAAFAELMRLARDERFRGLLMLDAPGRAYVSRMTSGTAVKPHSGPSNHRLRLHLALVVPALEPGQRLGMRVGGALLAPPFPPQLCN
jgi:hypothetical protein